MGAPLIMLGLGVGQGVMAYQQGQQNADSAEANAANARAMQTYEEQVKQNNIALIAGESKRAQTQQGRKNAAKLGSVTAAMGASGVQVTGTFMDVLGQEVMLGANKTSMIRSQGLRQQTGARNAGDLAVWRQDVAEYQYSQQARDARRGGTMGLIMGIAGGAAGFSSENGDWWNIFGTTPPAQASSALGSGGYGGGAFGGNNVGYGGGYGGSPFG
jgi:hypothetical protein